MIVNKDLKTSDNSPDETLTPKAQGGQNLRVSVVYVLNMRGEPLMPTTPRKARILLKEKKAYVVTRTPFTIKLKIATGEVKQNIVLDIDSGSKHVGLSAKTAKQEVFSAEMLLRSDIVKLISERRMYRRTRRSRKIWYRKPRFLNRVKSKKSGWLAPSIQHKLDSHIKIVKNILDILPISSINVEVAAFDTQKLKNPKIEGEEYQEGEQFDFYNVREYILHRDKHICQHCNGKSKEKVLHVHHIESRQTGGDSPDNLITLCKICHNDHHEGKINIQFKKHKSLRNATFMSIVRWKMVDKLKEFDLPVRDTYGYQTKYNRLQIGLSKSHINDAFAISGFNQIRCQSYLIKQVRRQNRKLFKGVRSHIRNTAFRFVKGFQRYDKVSYSNIEYFILGRRIGGYFSIRKLNGETSSKDVNYKKLRLLESFRTLLWENF